MKIVKNWIKVTIKTSTDETLKYISFNIKEQDVDEVIENVKHDLSLKNINYKEIIGKYEEI